MSEQSTRVADWAVGEMARIRAMRDLPLPTLSAFLEQLERDRLRYERFLRGANQ